jgi:sulfur carrier protein ThiS
MVKMAKPFIVQIKDEKQRRIIIDKTTWNDEELKKGDYIEVVIKKVRTTNEK